MTSHLLRLSASHLSKAPSAQYPASAPR